MNKWEGHERILRLASERGVIYLYRAVEATGASIPTIRRDFEELAKSGAIERTWGGVCVIR